MTYITICILKGFLMKYYALDTPYTKKLFHHVTYPVSLVTLDRILAINEDIVLIIDDIYEEIPEILITKFYNHTVFYLHKSTENQQPRLIEKHQEAIKHHGHFIAISIFQPKQIIFSKLFSKAYQTHMIIGEKNRSSLDILNMMLPDISSSHDKATCLFVDLYPGSELMSDTECMSLWHYYQAIHHDDISIETLIKRLVKAHPTKPLQILTLGLSLKEYLDMDLTLLETLMQTLKSYYNIYYLCDHIKSAVDDHMISTADIIYTDGASKAYIEKSFQKEVIAIELLS